MRKAFDELTVADVMRRGVVAVPEAMSLRGAARVMAAAGAGAAPVTDARGRCVGLLLASDVLRWVADGGGAGPGTACYWSEWQMGTPGGGEVGRRMTADPPAVTPDAPLREAARRLLASRTAAVVVDRRHRPVSVLTAADILAAVATEPRSGVNGRPGPVPNVIEREAVR